ncbi:MAG: cell division protein FtsZ, partial [Candidatus Portnoybacteria bacterium CG10_big_fil_rev_8_21_14_0_10_36_7]
TFEGSQRMKLAREGLAQLKERVDALITIPNDRILQIIDRHTPLLEAFATVDDILRQGVQGISDLITIPGIVNVDFADIKAIMKDAGSALMGIGKANGDDRASEAARQAINSPLLELSIDGASGVLFNLSGGADLTMTEINEAAKVITESIDPEAKVIFGAVTDDKLKKGEIKITVIATGFKSGELKKRESDFESGSQREVSRSVSQSASVEPVISRQEPIVRQNVQPVVEQPKKKPIPIFDSKLSSIEEDDELDIPTFIRKKMK